MHRRRVRRQLKFRQNRIDHGIVPLQQIGEQNLVLNQLGGFSLQLGGIAREQFLETLPRFRPVFFQKRNLRQIETGIPKFRIKPSGFG